MLNYLRADLYRLRASGVLLGIALYPLAIMGLLVAVNLLAGAARNEWSMSSLVDMTANMGFGAGMLPLASGFAATYLVASDWKTRGLKSLLATPHARRSYVLSKIAQCALFAVVNPIIMLATFAVVPELAGIPYETVPDLASALQWLGEASVVCFGYAALSTLLSLLASNETVAYLLLTLTGLGTLENIGQAVLALAVTAVPACTDIANAMLSGMLLPQARAVGMGLEALGLSAAATLRVTLVPLAWAAASTVLALAAFKRRTL